MFYIACFECTSFFTHVDQLLTYLIVIDFESTCWKDKKGRPEISKFILYPTPYQLLLVHDPMFGIFVGVFVMGREGLVESKLS